MAIVFLARRFPHPSSDFLYLVGGQLRVWRSVARKLLSWRRRGWRVVSSASSYRSVLAFVSPFFPTYGAEPIEVFLRFRSFVLVGLRGGGLLRLLWAYFVWICALLLRASSLVLSRFGGLLSWDVVRVVCAQCIFPCVCFFSVSGSWFGSARGFTGHSSCFPDSCRSALLSDGNRS